MVRENSTCRRRNCQAGVLLDSADPEAIEQPMTNDAVRVAAHSAVLLYAELPG